ncbi:hypothetical protein EDB83DRAFT_2323581 [Lactarius deliciosus]|nr:hypothetical protein EDB83DRAFT_2323581 [Lactarius deliciosus]
MPREQKTGNDKTRQPEDRKETSSTAVGALVIPIWQKRLERNTLENSYGSRSNNSPERTKMAKRTASEDVRTETGMSPTKLAEFLRKLDLDYGTTTPSRTLSEFASSSISVLVRSSGIEGARPPQGVSAVKTRQGQHALIDMSSPIKPQRTERVEERREDKHDETRTPARGNLEEGTVSLILLLRILRYNRCLASQSGAEFVFRLGFKADTSTPSQSVMRALYLNTLARERAVSRISRDDDAAVVRVAECFLKWQVIDRGHGESGDRSDAASLTPGGDHFGSEKDGPPRDHGDVWLERELYSSYEYDCVLRKTRDPNQTVLKQILSPRQYINPGLHLFFYVCPRILPGLRVSACQAVVSVTSWPSVFNISATGMTWKSTWSPQWSAGL